MTNAFTPPVPPPMPAQTLVDLLKHPFCVGEAQRRVLEQLSRHYHRPFSDHWDFVEYVTDNKLPLDLTTPPVRPESIAEPGSRCAKPSQPALKSQAPRAPATGCKTVLAAGLNTNSTRTIRMPRLIRT